MHRNAADRPKNVKEYVRRFFSTIEESELQGWCERTDRFCAAVASGDPDGKAVAGRVITPVELTLFGF